MNKADAIKKISSTSGVSQADTKKVMEAFMCVVEEALIEGDDVIFKGFGRFANAPKRGRQWRNPGTGMVVDIPSKRNPSFKFGGPVKLKIENAL